MNPRLLTLLSATGLALTTQAHGFVEDNEITEEVSTKRVLMEEVDLENFSTDDANVGCGDGGCTRNSGCGR